MFTWISDISRARAAFARAFLVAAILPLAGCFEPQDGALSFLASGHEKVQRDVLRKVPLFGGDVVVRGPSGYCIDRRALRNRKEGGFALLASCETLSGVRGHAVEPVVMTVSVMPVTPAAVRPTIEQITAMMAPAKPLASHQTRDVAMVQFASGGEAVLPGGDARHWRGGMMVNGHMVALALYARKGSPMAGKDGRALMTDLARSIRRSSPKRPVQPQTVSPPEPEIPSNQSEGLSTDSG